MTSGGTPSAAGRASRGRSAVEFACVLLIGATAFGLVLGFGILDPRNIAWMQSGDAAQYYLGWSYFRSSPLAWPPADNPRYGLELASTIFFADVVPLVALVLKATLAPSSGPWQFHGYWLLSCFVLQAAFAYRLSVLFLADVAERLLAVAIVAFSPVLLWRLPGPHAEMGHLTLCAQWILLWAGLLSIRAPKSRQAIAWLILAAVASMVHVYLLAMALVLWFADVARRLLLGGRPWSLAAEAAVMACIVPAGLWLAGFRWFGGSGMGDFGFGHFRANLLTLLDPRSTWSFVIRQRSVHPGEDEGFGYIGAGGLLLLFTALWAVRKTSIPRLPLAFWPVTIAILGLSAFAVSNAVALGPWEVVALPLPDLVAGVAAMFRSAGRMIWPLHYAVLFGTAVILARNTTLQRGRWLLALALLLQIGDGAAGWVPIRREAQVVGSTWQSPLQNPFWNEAATHYDRIRFVPTFNKSPPWRELSSLALRHGIETDAVYLARVPTQALHATRATGLSMLQSGHFEPGTFYVLYDLVACRALDVTDPTRDLLARIDGLIVLAPAWLVGHRWPDGATPLRRAADSVDTPAAILCSPDADGRILPMPRTGE